MPPAVCEPAEADVVAIYAEGCSATVHRLGATVVSWTVGGEEKLFVRFSPSAIPPPEHVP